MVADIYLYGEVVNWQSDQAAENGYVTLKSVVDQLNNHKDAEEINVHIHSPGGDVTEGFAIYSALRASGKKINTINSGMCFSIATVIFLAGDTRQSFDTSEFLFHNPWGFAGGDADDVEGYAEMLRDAENKIIKLYAEKTNLTKSRAKKIMKEDKVIDATQAKEWGFVTDLVKSFKAVAKLSIKKEDSMDDNTKKSIWDRLQKALNVFEEEAKSLVLKAADDTEVNFSDLKENEEPAVGDKAIVDGKDASGDYVMASGQTLTFENGELMKIEEAVDAVALQAANEDLKTQLATMEARATKAEGELETATKNLGEVKTSLEEIKAAFEPGVVVDEKEDKKPEPVEGAVVGGLLQGLNNLKN